MDAFQGSYRIQPRDLRHFSTLYLILRMLLLLQFQIFPSVLMLFTSGILSFITAVMVAIFQPYKVRTHNTTDSVLLTLMGIYFVSYHAQLSLNYENVYVPFTVQILAIGLLLLYCISLLVWKLLSGKLQTLVGKVKGVWSSIIHHQREHCSGEWVECFNREQDMNETNSYPPRL
jgi:hypothetical protein